MGMDLSPTLRNGTSDPALDVGPSSAGAAPGAGTARLEMQ
jgi:hypothetical protein